MSKSDQLDEIEVIDLEEYTCSGTPIPKHVTYYLIKIDDEKIRVKSPLTAEEIMIAADLDPGDYALIQKLNDGTQVELQPNQVIDLRTSGIEHFITVPLKEISIMVNSRPKKVTKKKLSTSEVEHLAYENPPTGENVSFTITYYNGPKKNPEGTMVPGGTVKIKNGMVFNVTPTDKS